MLIVNRIVYCKPYRILLVGRAKLVVCRDLIIIICDNYTVIYKNYNLIGSISIYGMIYVEDVYSEKYNTFWTHYTLCGYNVKSHAVPFYNYDEYVVSVYGFKLTQHRSDSCRTGMNIELYANLMQI